MAREARKIYSSGKSSFILTLPKKWVSENDLNSGDLILMDVGKNEIRIFPKEPERGKKEALIDDRGLKGEALVRRIISFYIAGYDSIVVRYYNEEQRKAITSCSELLIGFEVLEDIGKEIQTEVFLDFKRLRTTDIVEKISRICHSMFSDFCKAFHEYDPYLCTSIMSREKEIDKLHFLILRQLKIASDYSDVRDFLEVQGKMMEYRTVVRALERVADHAANIARALMSLKKPIPELCALTNLASEMLQTSVVSFFKLESEFAEEVLENYDDLLDQEQDYLRYILDRDVEEALLVKTIIDSLFRIAGYSADIAEVAINLSVVQSE
ncbi:MAG: PhoU domain-containing protein [Archaeoglobaceae archaeon]